MNSNAKRLERLEARTPRPDRPSFVAIVPDHVGELPPYHYRSLADMPPDLGPVKIYHGISPNDWDGAEVTL